MNDEGREILMRAVLAGVPQTTGIWSDTNRGRCVLGLLNEALHGNPVAWMGTNGPRGFFGYPEYDISSEEADELQRLNDAGVDFLTLARKFGQD